MSLEARAKRPCRVDGRVQSLRRDEAALSEIVGALMLVVIVVAAGTSLGAFLLHKQKQVQAQEQAELQRALESLLVTDLDPELNTTAGDRWLSFNVTLVSLHERTSRILSIEVNDHPARSWATYRLNQTSGQYEAEAWTHDQTLRVAPRERLHIILDVDDGLFGAPVLSTTDRVDVRFMTDLGNTFGRAFLPPGAIAQVLTQEQWNGTGFEPFVVLDGSLSDAPDGSSLVRWNWTVDPGTGDEQTLHGRKVRVEFPSSGIDHTIRLEVTDEFGMKATDEIVYFH